MGTSDCCLLTVPSGLQQPAGFDPSRLMIRPVSQALHSARRGASFLLSLAVSAEDVRLAVTQQRVNICGSDGSLFANSLHFVTLL